jgi:hypothetical protein
VLTVHWPERGKIVKNKLLFSGAGALKGGGGGFAVDQRLYSKKTWVYGTPMPELTITHLFSWSTP